MIEDRTTPESLQMISNLLTKHAGSPLHDTQVHVYDAVGRPIYTHNRNSKTLKNCEMGKLIVFYLNLSKLHSSSLETNIPCAHLFYFF